MQPITVGALASLLIVALCQIVTARKYVLGTIVCHAHATPGVSNPAIVSYLCLEFNQCTGGDACINISDCSRFAPHYNEPARWSDSLRNEFRTRVCKREKSNGMNVYKVCCQRTVKTNDNRKRGLDVTTVRLGEFDLSSTIDCDKRGELCALPPQDIAVERMILHEAYSARRKVNDIALIRLAQAASFNDKNLPNLNPNLTIHSSQMCAVTRIVSENCIGDTGGPLMSISQNGRYVLYGVHAYGANTCVAENELEVCVRVNSFIEWKLSKIEE
uniref:Peptidase S1 domain-containing protein n=1 Tax=Anopheles epiroticus TaxID=199890 RepID=A0A182PAL5_9DIPT